MKVKPIPTSIYNISGTISIRIPAHIVKEMSITKDILASLRMVSKNKIEIVFNHND